MFRKTLIVLSICSIVLLSLVACSNSATPDAPNTVHMSDTAFKQTTITIKKGESIHLVADTLTPHTIANGTWEGDKAKPSTEPGAPKVQDLQIGGNSSASIGPFNTAGTFQLYCTIHGGMNLQVIVK